MTVQLGFIKASKFIPVKNLCYMVDTSSFADVWYTIIAENNSGVISKYIRTYVCTCIAILFVCDTNKWSIDEQSLASVTYVRR